MLMLAPCDGTAGDQDSLTFLGALIQMAQPRVVLEAGTYRGHFALLAGRLVQRWGGYVFTADPIEHNWIHLIAANALQDTVEFVQDDFVKVGERLTAPADFAFIDSGPPFLGGPGPTDPGWDHGVRFRHYELAKQWVRPGGLVLVDDVNATDWQGSLRIREEATLLFPGGRGLSLWRKPP